jgi:glycosyltransferase involved in cell wall biosynthesis
MRTWLLTVGEPLPTDSGQDRAWRTGLLARQLVARGHEVVWWSSAFDHFGRRLRSPIDTPIAAEPGLTVWHLSGTAYRRNISFQRVRNHQQVADAFRRLAGAAPRPDVILSSLPTLELCVEAVEYGRAHDVPVALDVRDLWPDVLIEMAPAPARPLGRLALSWMTRQLRRSATGARAILGITDEFVQWGVDAAGREPSTDDRVFPMGYSSHPPGAEALRAAADRWRALGLENASPRPVICFFGTLGWMFDFDTVLSAAARLQQVAPEVAFVICGGGNNLEVLQRRAADLPNVIMPGRVGAPDVWYLMQHAMAGLAPYRPLRNFDDNLPNKPIEYLAGGLPIIACRLRVLTRLIDEHNCGVTYAHRDVDGLVQAVLMFVRHPERRASMAAHGVRLYRDRFVAERVYDDMAAHLEHLATRSVSAADQVMRAHGSTS